MKVDMHHISSGGCRAYFLYWGYFTLLGVYSLDTAILAMELNFVVNGQWSVVAKGSIHSDQYFCTSTCSSSTLRVSFLYCTWKIKCLRLFFPGLLKSETEQLIMLVVYFNIARWLLFIGFLQLNFATWVAYITLWYWKVIIYLCWWCVCLMRSLVPFILSLLCLAGIVGLHSLFEQWLWNCWVTFPVSTVTSHELDILVGKEVL